MDKVYTRLNFVNDAPPALNAENLNRIDKAIDDLDDRIIEGETVRISQSAYDMLPDEEKQSGKTFIVI